MPEQATITASSPATPADPFVRFVRAVEGKPVTRFVTGQGGVPRAGRFFGADRKDGKLVYDTKAVHAITADEWEQYGNVYTRNILDRDLVEVTRKDFDDYRAAMRGTREAKSDAAGGAGKDSNGSAKPTGGDRP